MRKAWAAIKSYYPPEALEVIPPLWSCPMHPELMETAHGTCSICGMTLEPIYATQPQLSQMPLIRAEVVAPAPLEVGKKENLRIRLIFNDSARPVELSDLEETHTRKIHLLIIDRGEIDYHHEHPEPLGNGEYAFSFTPSRSDTYRLWADLKPVRTHIQQYSIADIPSKTPGRSQLTQEPENHHAEIGGYKFDLSFEKPLIQEKDTVAAKLSVGDRDGPVVNLQVVIGAFGHFVAFSEDFSTILHLHPIGPAVQTATTLGGPDLPFYFRSNQPGLIRLFAQVRIADKDLFPRFVVRVQPLRHLPSR